MSGVCLAHSFGEHGGLLLQGQRLCGGVPGPDQHTVSGEGQTVLQKTEVCPIVCVCVRERERLLCCDRSHMYTLTHTLTHTHTYRHKPSHISIIMNVWLNSYFNTGNNYLSLTHFHSFLSLTVLWRLPVKHTHTHTHTHTCT